MSNFFFRLLDDKKKVAIYRDYVNPDGSIGGRVAEDATVHPTAYVERFGKVLSGAHVGPYQRVRDGDMVLATGKTIRFG